MSFSLFAITLKNNTLAEHAETVWATVSRPGQLLFVTSCPPPPFLCRCGIGRGIKTARGFLDTQLREQVGGVFCVMHVPSCFGIT